MSTKVLSTSDKVELALMKADIASLKSDVKDIKDGLNKFIDAAHKEFAKEREFVEFKNEIKSELSWNKNRIFTLGKDIAITGAIVTLLVKQYF